jgi:hypothetical protein
MSVDLVKNKFDNQAFNVDFTKYIDQQKETEHQLNIAKLKQLNTEVYKKKISDMSFNEVLVEWRETLTGIMDDVINMHLQPSVLLRDNRLFFTGITLIIIVVLFYFFYWLFFGFSQKIIKDEHIFNISLNIPEQKQSIVKMFMEKMYKGVK